MLPVLSPQAIREADAWAMAHEPISSIALMERAARACTDRLLERIAEGRFGPVRSVHVVAGMGNNGGDGLAMARMLAQTGLMTTVTRVRCRPEPSPDNERNAVLLREAGARSVDARSRDDLSFADADLIIDALFGTGLNATLTDLAKEAVQLVSGSGRPVVAIDMPSGLFADDNSRNDPEAIVRASLTLTLEVPKLSLFFAENAGYVGDWEVVPIGLDAGFVRGQPTAFHLIEANDAHSSIRSRSRFSHKGTFGHALLAGGSPGKMGAMILAVKAALRSGAGLVTAAVPGWGVAILQASAPEAMCATGIGVSVLEALPMFDGFTAIGIGPGLSTDDQVHGVLEMLLRDARVPLVIDADALNILARHPRLLDTLPQRTVLTPHPKEFERLVGSTYSSGHDRLHAARSAAQRWRCHIMLKGAFTAICSPEGQVLFNPTGNPGMAKGGSGDALTGLLTGLLAQGYAPGDACLLGAYLHGFAGDLAAARLTQEGMTALDLVDALPLAWGSVSRSQAGAKR